MTLHAAVVGAALAVSACVVVAAAARADLVYEAIGTTWGVPCAGIAGADRVLEDNLGPLGGGPDGYYPGQTTVLVLDAQACQEDGVVYDMVASAAAAADGKFTAATACAMGIVFRLADFVADIDGGVAALRASLVRCVDDILAVRGA